MGFTILQVFIIFIYKSRASIETSSTIQTVQRPKSSQIILLTPYTLKLTIIFTYHDEKVYIDINHLSSPSITNRTLLQSKSTNNIIEQFHHADTFRFKDDLGIKQYLSLFNKQRKTQFQSINNNQNSCILSIVNSIQLNMFRQQIRKRSTSNHKIYSFEILNIKSRDEQQKTDNQSSIFHKSS